MITKHIIKSISYTPCHQAHSLLTSPMVVDPINKMWWESHLYSHLLSQFFANVWKLKVTCGLYKLIINLSMNKTNKTKVIGVKMGWG